jgi:hypothetical protein
MGVYKQQSNAAAPCTETKLTWHVYKVSLSTTEGKTVEFLTCCAKVARDSSPTLGDTSIQLLLSICNFTDLQHRNVQPSQVTRGSLWNPHARYLAIVFHNEWGDYMISSYTSEAAKIYTLCQGMHKVLEVPRECAPSLLLMWKQLFLAFFPLDPLACNGQHMYQSAALEGTCPVTCLPAWAKDS